MSAALTNLDPKQQSLVRTRVRGLLEKSDAYRKLPPDEQRTMAKSLVDTVAYLADPKAGQAMPRALAQGDQGQQQGIGDAARAGAQAYKDLTGAVDFPKFVSGLIDGVFNAIVTASIRQMEAYQKLLENVTKSVDGFAKDNFTLNQGRDSLVDRFPNLLQIDNSGGKPRLAPTEEGEETGLADVKQAMGMGKDEDIDLSDETSEKELARRGQLEMAKLRQKQLATMVLMGINRIVVTNGLINAKVIVDVKTKDTSHDEHVTATSSDDTRTGTKQSGGGWFSSEYKRDNYTTIVKSATEDKSSADQSVETKAQLTGEVKINFKSETFPLDKLASQTDLEAVTERTK
ncbi:MAG TPA: hypothetical protein VG755_44495 [Nannocystaceae bacterium]|nr:hypothetical protein [Nannocystaceae bacterium]